MSDHRVSDSWLIQYKGSDAESVQVGILRNLEYRLARDLHAADRYDMYASTAYAISDYLIERWILTKQAYFTSKPKRVYYLSMEYLMGRSLTNNLINLGLYDACRDALAGLGILLDDIEECEADAGLGNGGLGRLAACFLDSMATMGLPAHGYGIRYNYGLFHQKIVSDRQVEMPDHWLALPNPWEVARPTHTFTVHFGGHTERSAGKDAKEQTAWMPAGDVTAMAYDTPIPGYGTETVNTLRLWTAQAAEEFDFDVFSSGDYIAACEKQVLSENISKVLYPNDSSLLGKELRLKQEYFLVSSSLQDIIRRFKHDHDGNWALLPDAIAIQLNDTHPALAIPEFMRLLVDVEGLSWETAWDLCIRTFAYTNHTLMPEALEEWSVSLLESLLPRHMEIIYLINHYFLMDVARRYPGDVDRLARMSIIAEDGVKRVRMAYLAVVGSHHVNGVAELHSRLMQETLFRDFADFYPGKFTNKTNGITPRRWLLKSNPRLADLITEAIGDGWVTDLSQLRGLVPYTEDAGFRNEWRAIKRGNKAGMAELISRDAGVIVSPDSLFDVQVKRMHEYKRQLLFALQIIADYLRIKEGRGVARVPRTCLIGGKAAPGYYMAKLTIHLINRIADMVNRDPEVNGFLRIAFLPNYRVSLAEQLIPAADLSEQISTAGMEASGTGNMKFALNGALTIGTLDGANIEILEEVGTESIFIFGHTAEQIADLRREGYRPDDYIARSPELQAVLHLLDIDFFCPGEPGLFRPLYDALVFHDPFFLMADFDLYRACHDRAVETYRDRDVWTRLSILNVARCGKFSSDRTIMEYARDIWRAEPVNIHFDQNALPHNLLAGVQGGGA
ncbi:MAG: Maltodextrin phosphorylase [bacterium ADurb.Bin429]|nr:MAG: Maltodextrin phosphorylase [bacterium ADurb.Bin429]